jgi:hypothetical protein
MYCANISSSVGPGGVQATGAGAAGVAVGHWRLGGRLITVEVGCHVGVDPPDVVVAPLVRSPLVLGGPACRGGPYRVRAASLEGAGCVGREAGGGRARPPILERAGLACSACASQRPRFWRSCRCTPHKHLSGPAALLGRAPQRPAPSARRRSCARRCGWMMFAATPGGDELHGLGVRRIAVGNLGVEGHCWFLRRGPASGGHSWWRYLLRLWRCALWKCASCASKSWASGVGPMSFSAPSASSRLMLRSSMNSNSSSLSKPASSRPSSSSAASCSGSLVVSSACCASLIAALTSSASS